MDRAEVSSRDGSPKLYVDGEKRVPVLFGLSDIPGAAANTYYAHKNIAAFASCGIHLITLDVELREGWHKTEPFEWESMQEEIAAAMEADPQTGVILRLHVNPPYWWMRDNREECVSYRDEEVIDDGEQLRLIRCDGAHHLRVSLASRKWLSEAGECLRLFCENVWNTPEGRAVLGIQVACGMNGEWHQWGADRSRPMTDRFRRLLKEQYGTDEKLREAWGDPLVRLGTAHFVPEIDRPGDDGIFRDPVRSRDVMDSQLAIQISVTEAILHFCEIIKSSWGRPVLTGSFYAYYLGSGGDYMPLLGHTLPQKLYERRDVIDFLCGPFPYKQNRQPECVPMQRALIESNRLHGVLWLTEMDQHPAGTEHFIGGDPSRMDETVAQLRRNVLQPVLSGAGMWYYDHRLIPQFVPKDGKNPYAGSIFRKNGWWDNPRLLDEIGKMQRIFEKYALRPYEPASDVLVVFSTENHYAVSKCVDEHYFLMEAVMQTGASADCIYLSDLEIAEMERYKVVIFANAYRLREEQKRVIRKKTKGKQVVWMYAAGYSDDRTLSDSHIEELIGMKLKRIAPEERICTLSADDPAEYEILPSAYTPFYAVSDPEAEILALYSKSRETAAARKGNIWYIACPRLDLQTARRIMKAAGVHCYTESADPILAGAGLLAINSYEGGRRVLTLRNGKMVCCDLPPLTTALFDAETGERLL